MTGSRYLVETEGCAPRRLRPIPGAQASAAPKLAPVSRGSDDHRCRPADPRSSRSLANGLQFRFRRAGHILGAASVELNAGGRTILFRGGVGRPADLIMKPTDPPSDVGCIVVESTYGDRTHPRDNHALDLTDVVRRVAERAGRSGSTPVTGSIKTYCTRTAYDSFALCSSMAARWSLDPSDDFDLLRAIDRTANEFPFQLLFTMGAHGVHPL